MRFDISEKVNVCTEKELQETIGADLVLKLYENRDKFKLELDNRKFSLLCTEINDVLADSSYFLRVSKLWKKFRYLSLKSPKKQTIVRQLSSCVYQKFNIVSIEYRRKLRKKFKPIDLVYKPVTKPNEQIKCYFSRDLSKVYRNTCSRGEKLQHGFANQCYYCYKFFARPDKYKRCIEHCYGVLGIVYSFNKQNLVTFEDNIGCKGDLPAIVYIDFETTASTDNCIDPEQISMFFVSYVIIVAFHPKLQMDRVIIQCSFGHSLEKLTATDYLTNDQMSFVDENLIKQLKDSALNVHGKKCKNVIA